MHLPWLAWRLSSHRPTQRHSLVHIERKIPPKSGTQVDGIAVEGPGAGRWLMAQADIASVIASPEETLGQFHGCPANDTLCPKPNPDYAKPDGTYLVELTQIGRNEDAGLQRCT